MTNAWPDPAVFRPEAIDPETAKFNEQLEAQLANFPRTWERPPEETRAARESGQGMFGPIYLSPKAEERTIELPGRHPVPVRVFRPARPRAVYLHIHGGGWVLGRAHHSDQANEARSELLNMAIVSVDYRLAPEHPYPAGPDDCETVAMWLKDSAQSEFSTSSLMIGGESAGAHLAAVTLVRMRDRHGFTGFSAANMVYGAFDPGLTPSCRNWGERELVLSTRVMQWFSDHFCQGHDVNDPDINPLRADLRGLPPAIFSVGTLDPLLDDSLFMAARWMAAGNEALLKVYPGGVHGFNAFPNALGAAANDAINAFLESHL